MNNQVFENTKLQATDLICPRCNQRKEDLDSMYRVRLEVYSVNGATNSEYTAYDNTLEEHDYLLCGNCINLIERFLRMNRK